MSEPAPPPVPPPPVPPLVAPAPPPPRSGCLTALMVVAGVIMLLPGLCALIFGGAILTEGAGGSDILGLVLIGLVIGFAGIMLIRQAVRGRRR